MWTLLAALTRWPDGFILNVGARSIAGSLRNKAIFRLSPKVPAHLPPDTTPPALLESLTMDLGYARATKEPPKCLSEMEPFVNAVRLALIESFLRAVGDYFEVALDYAHEVTSPSPRPDHLAALDRYMIEVEVRVGGSRDTLYGVIRHLRHHMANIRTYHKQVLEAYARKVMVLAKGLGRTPEQIEDNLQAGMMGLQRAIYYFDPERGKALSGIAAWWVRAAILSELKNGANLVRTPANVWQLHRKYEDIRTKHCLNEGEWGEIARLAGKGHTFESVEEVYMLVGLNRPASLEAPLTDEGGGSRVDKVPDENQVSADEGLIEAEETATLGSFMEALEPGDRCLVSLAFGTFTYLPKRHNSVEPSALRMLEAKLVDTLGGAHA